MTIQPFTLRSLAVPNAFSESTTARKRSSSSSLTQSFQRLNQQATNLATGHSSQENRTNSISLSGLASGSSETNSSSKVQPGKTATLTLASDASGLVGSSGTYELSGNKRATKLVLEGGNENEMDDGTDVRAIVNGHDLIVEGNRFNFRDVIGSVTFGAGGAQGGRFDTIKVNSQARQFELSGVDANGTANRTDRVVRTNDQTATGTRSHYLTTNSIGRLQSEFTSGLQQIFDTNSVQSKVAEVQLQGGDSQGNSQGNDSVAMSDCMPQSKSTNQATMATQHGLYHAKVVKGFVNQMSPTTLTAIQPSSGESTLTANGANSRTDDASNSKLPIKLLPISTNSSDNLITEIVAGTAAAMQSISNSIRITEPTGVDVTAYREMLQLRQSQICQALVLQQFNQSRFPADNLQSNLRFAPRADEEDSTSTVRTEILRQLSVEI